jgi:hypothetical protein
VILYGSVARGQAKEHSDVDLIIVASGLPELKRRDVLPPFPKPSRIQDIWMTPEELEDMGQAKTAFVVDALLEGRVLLDGGGSAGKTDCVAEEAEGETPESGVDDSERRPRSGDKLRLNFGLS